MSATETTQLATQATPPRDPFMTLLATQKAAIASVLPKHLTPERVLRLVYTAATKTPDLRKCTPESLVTSLVACSQLGLEPNGPQGHAYMIPRYNKKIGGMECTLQVGYKGLLELMRRSGQIMDANAAVIYADELRHGLFEASIEPPDIKHAWSTMPVDRDPKQIVGAYCTVRTRDGGRYQVILTRDEIDMRRARGGDRSFSPWETDYAAMARKSAIRALLQGGMIPMSVELSQTFEDDEDEPAPSAALPAAGRSALGLTGPASVPESRQIAAPVDVPEASDREPEPVVAAPPKATATPKPKAKATPTPEPAPTPQGPPDAPFDDMP